MKYTIQERVTESGRPSFHVIKEGKTVIAFGNEPRAIQYAKAAERMFGRKTKRQVREAWDTVRAKQTA